MYISFPEESTQSHCSPRAHVLRICVRSKPSAEERVSDVEQDQETLRAVGGVHRNQGYSRVKCPLLGLALAISFPALAQMQPPLAPVRDAVDTHFGVPVHDSYRYMEDLANPEVQTWLKGQADFTRSILDRISGREGLRSRVEQLRNAATSRVGDVRMNGAWVYSLKQLTGENTPKLYVRDGLHGNDRLLVDPESMSEPEGTHNSITFYAPSPDNKYLAFGIAGGGSENTILHVLDLTRGKETGDVIDRAELGGPSWTEDHRLFYTRLQKLEPGARPEGKYLNARAYVHTLGTDPDQDTALLGSGTSPSPFLGRTTYPFVGTARGCPWLFGVVLNGVQKEWTIYLAPVRSLEGGSPAWRKVVDASDGVVNFTGHGNDLFLLTHRGASNGKILKLSLADPQMENARELLPASKGVITGLAAAGDALYVVRSKGGRSELLRLPYAPGSSVETLKLPFVCDVSRLMADEQAPGVAFFASAWTRVGGILAYDPKLKRVLDIGLQPQGPFDNPRNLVMEEVKVEAKDGVLVPMSIVHRKGLKRDGNNPLILDGYGSYGIAQTPGLDLSSLAWYERGGIIAVAHVRGGGEYGEDWHLAGSRLNKPNTWRDGIACAEWLIAHRYTSAAKLAIQGSSAGGIFVGRAITERPDLFAAAIDASPLSDMIRFESSPGGAQNIPEFGSITTEDGFRSLFEMSPYHKAVDSTRYPAVLLTTGMNDPRVAPWQAAKMAARLQAATSSGKPILLRIDYDAGHGFGSTKKQLAEQHADMMAFLLWQLGAKGFGLTVRATDGSLTARPGVMEREGRR
jgi:prolyl oligopeptidase